MSDVGDLIHAVVFFLLLIALIALAAYVIWLIPIDQTLKWIFSIIAIAGVLVFLYAVFEETDWDWWSSL